jgi:hypothetical protein
LFDSDRELRTSSCTYVDKTVVRTKAGGASMALGTEETRCE